MAPAPNFTDLSESRAAVISAVSIRESAPSPLKPVDMTVKAVVNKSFKGKDEKD